ncbi:3037_t:CDS:1, partial [Funneliformis caledonium]
FRPVNWNQFKKPGSDWLFGTGSKNPVQFSSTIRTGVIELKPN